ncbi:MAG: aromatic ring-hydroxylating dioxygenase subunit alpha [Isosphaera sp.]|nr:aromatic ring-hydroxylating dioxygenase subunit alpha [Isosphaera sp.]
MTPFPSPEEAARLALDLDRGVSLPASWYTDPAVLAREHDRIFRRGWQYVGRADQLARPGDYVTGEAGGVPVVVVRAEQGLRGFVNVCRHRRHLVAVGAGNGTLLRCPYHGWCYDLDGRLRSAPRADREPGFDPTGLSLLPVRVDGWGPFVFANADPGAGPLASTLGDLPDIAARNGLDFAGLRFRSREGWRAAGNWKVLLENYLECYHCPVAHPGFSSVVDVRPDAYSLHAGEWFSAQTAPARSGAPRAAYDAGGPVALAQYYYLWPNLTLSTHPGHPNLAVHVWLPDGPDHTRGFTDRFFPPDAPEEFVRALAEFTRQVVTEDQSLTASVQLGLRAGLPERGRLLPRSERLVLHFQKLVLRALSAG